MIKLIWAIIVAFFTPKKDMPEPIPTPPPVPPPAPTPAPYKWATPSDALHSFRVICDENGLTPAEKDKLCQVLNCESGFRINAVHKNNDRRQTTDYGICMYNSYWYKNLISPEEALNNPEKAVRLFIKQYKAGHLNDWVCASTGMYKSRPARSV